ncbi:hypothetical protein N7462_004310 [Penicillium macrosclerotiorum]|uniref:uncharacterized protein n=1 Tax=Penicillium macrosclerotiorum TaxID=303699 RepID=UPI0025471475|nr:uncharacterized protein N7462_004310 [Penicillium macrosclerotiorum]KAJ5689918.1 hypothetical protein N7462_004310 [Penicillium macrosclerotiorum]
MTKAYYKRESNFLPKFIAREQSLPEPPSYAEVISEINRVQDTINEVNAWNLQLVDSEVVDASNPAFLPEIKSDVTRADAYESRSERPLRVLSLDGGGVRGLSSLMLLQNVLDKAAPGKRPWEVFDMIGGTSTGGLIAIMLGRLKMSIKDCIDEYNKVMDQVFPPTDKYTKNIKLFKNGEYYDSSNLEKIIQDLIKRKLGDADASLLDESNPCKIFLMAVNDQAGNNRAPCFLRSYKNPNDMGDQTLVNIKLWQAARATSAAPAYFKPLEVNGYTLVDGGLGANNPLGWLWTEVLGVFGPARSTDCFLSIGTAIASNTKVERIKLPGPETLKSYISVATNSEITHIMFRTLIDAFAPAARQKKYWRLNVSRPIPGEEKVIEEGYLWWKKKHLVKVLDNYESPGELDDLQALKKLEVWTKDYIEQEVKLIQGCVEAIRNSLAADA